MIFDLSIKSQFALNFCLFEYILDLLLGSKFGKDCESKITIKKTKKMTCD